MAGLAQNMSGIAGFGRAAGSGFWKLPRRDTGYYNLSGLRDLPPYSPIFLPQLPVAFGSDDVFLQGALYLINFSALVTEKKKRLIIN